MNVERLVEMANDIGDYFAAEPEREEAINGVLNHLIRFWEPSMRKQIVVHLHAGGAGLNPIPRQAVERLAARMQASA